MNIFKIMYCRTFQTAFKLMLPVLPYREPQLIKSEEELCKILEEKKIKKILLVTDKVIHNLALTSKTEEALKEKGIEVVIYDETTPNPTTDNVEKALELYKKNCCQALIAFGGGSAMDCAKAVGARVARPKKSLNKMKGILKVRKRLPLLVAIPTTAGTGSETTLAAVITDSQTRHKYAINDFSLIPKYAMLNPSLTINLPQFVTATTGMDALTHAVEAYIGRSTTTSTRKNALQAVKLIFENIMEVYENGGNIVARENMLLASYKAGLAFTKSYVGYVHAIAHSLGGKYNIAHGLANAVILPKVLRAYGKKINKKLWEMGVYANLFSKSTSFEEGAKIFIEKIEKLNKDMQIPSKIEEIDEKDIPFLAKTAEKEANPLYPVPVLWSQKMLEKIYYEVKNG